MPPISPASAHAAQAAFFQRMGCSQQFRHLFGHLPDVHFFAKDLEGRFVAAGEGLVKRLGFSSEAEILGLTDADIHPARVVREIRADDLRVMRTREPLIDRVEVLFTRNHAKDWYVTTKLPVFDSDGEVIGVMGFVRPYKRDTDPVPGAARIEGAVAHIHANHRTPISIPDLARVAHVSVRQLNRLFQNVFGMSAQEFIVRTRVQAASDELVQTDKPLSEIAATHGFYDQSAFTRQFRQHTGETPARFRIHQRRLGPTGKA